jgi:hypothetical protein
LLQWYGLQRLQLAMQHPQAVCMQCCPLLLVLVVVVVSTGCSC